MISLIQKFIKRLTPEYEVSQTEAVETAKRTCNELGLPWLLPIHAKLSRGKWVVKTNWGNRGANATVVISGKTGEVIDTRFTPR